MSDFIDYYEEFHLQRTDDCNTIRNQLGSLETDYLKQRAVCITASQMAVLQNLLNLIGDAIYHLTNQDRRKKYDKKLEKLASSGALSVQQKKANSDYEQALACENKGRASEAILFAERAIKNNVYNMDAYVLMIRCCYQVGEYQKALDVAEKTAIKIYPDEVSFQQYAARIRTLHGDYTGAEHHIQNMLSKHAENSAGHIEQVVRLLYISKDKNFSDIERKQAESDAKNAIDTYLNENGADVEYRSRVATALIGLSERYYSEYENVSCKIIASKEDYEAILSMHEWAGQISADTPIQDAVFHIRELGVRKYNSDNTRPLLYLSLYCVMFFITVPALFASTSDLEEIIAGLAGLIPMFIFFVLPFIILLKVSFRPQWMIDRIRYTGIIDPLERFIIGYGQLFIWMVKKSFEIMWNIFKLIIAISR